MGENEHPVQFVACLSGVVDSGDFVLINSAQGYVGGSGIQPGHYVFTPRAQQLVGVDAQPTFLGFQQWLLGIMFNNCYWV